MKTINETERKYEAAAPLPELSGAGPVTSVRERAPLSLRAVYYDTDDGRLAGDGITLRRRTGGGDEGWHLKVPVGRDAREEIRAPLGEGAPDGPPGELLALVRSRVRRRPLLPVVTLETERAPRDLLDAGGAVLAELVVDRVTARSLGGEARWSEVEVELAGAGGTDVLDAVGARLTEAGLPVSGAPSKLARALAETGVAHPRPARAEGPEDDSAGAHVLAYARRQLRAIVQLDPAVRRSRPDAVHRMRVATRRLRSCLRVQRRVLDRAVTRPLDDELGWLAAGLGVERDREVVAERLAARLGELPPDLRVGPVARRLDAHFSPGRARGAVAALLDEERYLALLDALDALLAAPPLRKGAAKPARTALARSVARERERLDARVEAALAAPEGAERDAALHRARKAAKRARYAAETARSARRKAAERERVAFRRVQRVLGDHQDSVLAREALMAIAGEAHAAGEPSFSYGVMHARETELARARVRRLGEVRVG
ncbi:CYTH and CHAD domain-containing protein [Streptomyces sp. PT12]|uniref:CYTH and CHAD domain-containing protein n=1 Tax=Streptomyces sp. PT12 TaxID=1510197 RepID=UPI000DE4282A|nr:CYTH and CHAD domain-containing protein [Streptomyces sp. PT12]RBM23637.1 metal-binding protein [Streptomyces sp. PT12]